MLQADRSPVHVIVHTCVHCWTNRLKCMGIKLIPNTISPKKYMIAQSALSHSYSHHSIMAYPSTPQPPPPPRHPPPPPTHTDGYRYTRIMEE